MSKATPDGDRESVAELVVGIDLGTSNSLVAWCDEAGPRVLEYEGRGPIVPSVVRFAEDGSVEAVGAAAREHAVEYPERTVASVKRLMGRGLADVAGEVGSLGYRVEAAEHGMVEVDLGGSRVSPQEVSAIILKELKSLAEGALGKPVRKAVVTVPAYFDDAQRQATRDAGRIAGLEVVRILNEPTAAALAYNLTPPPPAPPTQGRGNEDLHVKSSGGRLSLNTKVRPEACSGVGEAGSSGVESKGRGVETVVVFDLGGGTFDVSVLRLRQTDQGMVDQVLATAGDTHLGGDDVDRLLIEMIQREIGEQFGVSGFSAATRQAFKRFAEAAKVRLSSEDTARLVIDLGEGRVYEREVTRGEFEGMIEPLVERTLMACRSALRAAKLTAEAIDRVILVGGSTRVPLVRERVGALFGREPYTALDPDLVVALGASVQGAILAGLRRDALLLDVVPLSLGIETMGGAVAKLIVANTTIPARATEFFSTYADNQTAVQINVYQGERELVQDCRLLGRFELKGIPVMPAGLAKVEVTFLVDANGILSVEAVEKRSERRASIQIVPNHGLTRERVAAMEAEALGHALADMTAHRIIDLRNQARLDLRAIEKQLAKVGDELGESERSGMEAKIGVVKGFLDQETPDAQAFQDALDGMDRASIPLAEKAIAKTLREDASRA
ncbi:MAG: Hsp70 family protein [Phycisphaeraceae bacterium]